MILRYLDYPDETGKAPMAIFNFALSSNSLYQLVQYWVSTLPNARDEYAKISSLQLPNPPFGYPRSNLAAYCKRHAGICALCTLRKYKLEHFSQLQLCHACDLKYFLKISKSRLDSLYTVRSRKRVYRRLLERELPYVTVPYDDSYMGNGTATWYLWDDVQRVKSKGYLRSLKHSKEILPKFDKEDYTYHLGPSQIAYLVLHWHCHLVFSTAFDWCKSKSIDKSIGIFGQIPTPRRPLIMEAAHFIEYRYRFDPNWQPPGPESLIEFIRIALPWANKAYWKFRPWNVSNFPRHPRSFVIDDRGISRPEKKRAERDMRMYQYRCSKIRAVLKAFPEILLSPKTWQKCMSEHRGLPIDHVRSMAYESSLTWRGYTPNDKEFGIYRSGSGEAYWESRLIESHFEGWRTGGEFFNVDIVKIKDGSVVVVPPIRQEDLEWREYHI